MQPIRPEEVLTREEYERAREATRRRIMAMKERRRVALGDHATLHFENRETMLYQVHEMLRAEESWQRPGAVEGELAAYNPVVPGERELSATLMLEYDDPDERTARLRALAGLESHLWLYVGEGAPVAATFEAAPLSAPRISSVQYVKFRLTAEQARLVTVAGTALRVVVDHPAYRAHADLGEATRRELAGDLEANPGRGGGEP